MLILAIFAVVTSSAVMAAPTAGMAAPTAAAAIPFMLPSGALSRAALCGSMIFLHFFTHLFLPHSQSSEFGYLYTQKSPTV
jgi:hypothetical protein